MGKKAVYSLFKREYTMKRVKQLNVGFLLIILLVTITNCGPRLIVQEENVYPQPNSEKGIVYFYRNKKFVGSLVSYKIYDTYNGKKVLIGGIDNGTYFFYHANTGKHLFRVDDVKRSINVKADKTYYIRVNIEMGAFSGQAVLTIMRNIEGESAVQSLEYAKIR